MSLRRQIDAPPLGITIVEYGSDGDCVQSNKLLCAELGCRHITIPDQDKPWSKALALNCGITRSNTRYIGTFDIDMIFPPDMVSKAMRFLKDRPRSLLLSQVYDLPENANISSIGQYAQPQYLHPRIGVGGIQIARACLFSMIRGYDEEMFMWGGADVDLAERAAALGLELVWMNDLGVNAFHQWHPRTDKMKHPARTNWHNNNARIGSAIVKNDRNWGMPKTVITQARGINEPELSVVLGTYNRKDLLIPCVRSIRAAAYPLKTEIVIVDGGSTDGTQAWCLSQFDITLIEQNELVGAIKAFNAGFEIARAEYVAHLNDDCIVRGHSLRDAIIYLEGNKNTVGQVALYFREPGGDFEYRESFCLPYANFSVTQKWLGDLVGWWGTLERTYSGDTRISLLIQMLGYKVVPLPYCQVEHLRVDDELRTGNDAITPFLMRWARVAPGGWFAPLGVPNEPIVRKHNDIHIGW